MRDTIFTQQTINNGNLSFLFFRRHDPAAYISIFFHIVELLSLAYTYIVAKLQFHSSLDLIRCDLWHWQTMNIFRFVCRARESLLLHVGGWEERIVFLMNSRTTAIIIRRQFSSYSNIYFSLFIPQTLSSQRLLQHTTLNRVLVSVSIPFRFSS